MFYIFRNKESGEITEGKYFRNDTIQIINPTNEVLEKYGWEILDDYPIEDEENNEEIEVSDEIIEDTEENNKA